jgi:hypothetical protein
MHMKQQDPAPRATFLTHAKSTIIVLLRKAGCDRSVLFGILSKVLSIVSGPLTALFITMKFTYVVQGFYYTFGSLLAMQVFVELGLGIIIIPLAGHEWSKLSINREGFIEGERDALSKLSSIARIVLKWYLTGSVIITVGLGFWGCVFFSHIDHQGVVWLSPWLALCLLNGLNLVVGSLLSLLEGCNQVFNVYRYRFFQGLCATLSIWAAILSGAGLWTYTVVNLITVIAAFIFIRSAYWNFFTSLFSIRHEGPKVDWRRDIFPLQWRMAVSCICGYLANSIFTPVLLLYQGSKVAGQMGMTFSFLNVVLMVSSAWLAPKFTVFSILAARRDYKELDHLFWKTTKVVFAVIIITGGAFAFVFFMLKMHHHPLAERLLDPLTTMIFLCAQVLLASTVPFSMYLRAHKKEPTYVLSIIHGVLTASVVVFVGKYYSVLGISVGYLAIMMMIVPAIFIIWYRCKTRWHRDGLAPEVEQDLIVPL